MSNFQSADEILDFAIAREEEANAYYNRLAGKMEHAWMAKVFEDFAKEELGHRNKLLLVKQGKTLTPSDKKVQDLKIADYTVDVDERAEMSYQEALILAMKREKVAFRLYNDLAATAPTEDLKQTFLALAQEEAKHKLRIEVEYDEQILKEN